NKFGLDFYLVDTAGVRKKSKVHENIEFYSVMRSVRAIEYADVCLLLIDAVEGVKSQDISIFGIAQRNHKGIVILVNKWDLVEKDTKSSAKFLEELQHRIAPFTDVPVIFTSALTKQRVLKALETAVQVYQDRSKKIQTSKLNDFLQEAVESNPPPSVKGKFIRIKYATQLPNPTPIFAFYCNRPQYIKDPYKRYLENKIREKFDFTGVPIRLFFRKK
ncbi:MAG: GTP-binding protein, partial [Bacteroidetes bacterium]|nr:GTP-binding protein [Bacteroidota bacterium]